MRKMKQKIPGEHLIDLGLAPIVSRYPRELRRAESSLVCGREECRKEDRTILSSRDHGDGTVTMLLSAQNLPE